MPPLTLSLLYEALSQTSGLVLQVSDVERARQKLYKLRADAKDPDLDCLSLVPSPTDKTQLWIVKK